MTDAVASPEPAAAATDRPSAPEWVILAIACVAQFMVVLDVSIVNVALPSIGRALHYSPTGLQWVVNAYVLTFAGFLLLGGRAADLFGRRRIYLFGLALFTLASLMGGVAQNEAWLTTARAIQGVGGAFLSPATLTIIVTTFTGLRRARAIGIWSAVAGAGGAAGSILGGVLTAELSWRWVLFVNIPIGVAGIAAAMRFLSEARQDGPVQVRGKLDVRGAVTVTAGLAALVYAVVGTDTHSWLSAQTLSMLGASVVLLGLFVLTERSAAAPLVPFRLFRSRAVTGANAVMLLVGAAFFAMWYFLSLYLQNVLHDSPLRAGLSFLPMAIAIIVGAQLSARALSKVGGRPVLFVGTVIAAAGFGWMSRIGPHSTYVDHVLGPGLLVSFALGLLFTPLAATATAGVAPQESGLASGVLNTSRQIGGSIGLAVLATVATARTHSALASSHGAAVGAAFTDGYSRAFEIAAVLGAAAFLCSFIVPSIRGPQQPEPSPGLLPEPVPQQA